MKKFYFTIFLAILITEAFGQNRKKVDSLLALYKIEQKIEEKVYLLDDLDEIYIYTKPDSAKIYIDEMQRISEVANYKHGILRAEFLLGHYYMTLGEMYKATTFFKKSLELSKVNEDFLFLPTILKNLSICESHTGNYAEAIRLMDSSASLEYKQGDFMRFGSAQNFIGEYFSDMGNYPKAMEWYQKALKTMDTITIKSYHKADLLSNIGGLLYDQGDYNEAIRHLEMAMEVYINTDDNLYQAETLIDMGNVFSAQKSFVKAIEYYNQGLEIAIKFDFPKAQEFAYGNLGHVYGLMNEHTLAIANFTKSLQIEGAETSGMNTVNYMSQLGYSYAMKNDFEKAFRYLDKSIRLADSIKVTNELQNALKYRGLAFEKKGDFKNSVQDLKRSQTIKDSLFSIEKAKQISELQTIYETEKKEAEIALQQEEISTLTEKAKVDTLTKGLYAGGMFTFLIVSGLLFFSFKQRIKKNRIEREKQEEIYKQEIEHKKKELTSQTLHLVQKNTFIQELKENLENLKSSPEKFKTEFRRIVMLLKKENASDKDWEVFKTYFADVHNDFDQKLKTLYADISEKEIRLAAFLRMNLTTKEIAATLNVLPDSILKSKYRLKKKLRLPKDEDLTDFLNTL